MRHLTLLAALLGCAGMADAATINLGNLTFETAYAVMDTVTGSFDNTYVFTTPVTPGRIYYGWTDQYIRNLQIRNLHDRICLTGARGKHLAIPDRRCVRDELAVTSSNAI